MSEEARPPYVKFEVRAVEDRSASVDSGHYVTKDVIFALVTPAGTRDQIEKEVESLLIGLDEGAAQERIPSAWPRLYRDALQRFKDNQEIPEHGTSVKHWPAVSPSQVKAILDANIRTIEDMADATDEALQRIGMGGVALKAKAKAWIESANGAGKVSEEIAALRIRNEQLETRDAEREEQFKLMQVRMEALEGAALKKEKA